MHTHLSAIHEFDQAFVHTSRALEHLPIDDTGVCPLLFVGCCGFVRIELVAAWRMFVAMSTKQGRMACASRVATCLHAKWITHSP